MWMFFAFLLVYYFYNVRQLFTQVWLNDMIKHGLTDVHDRRVRERHGIGEERGPQIDPLPVEEQKLEEGKGDQGFNEEVKDMVEEVKEEIKEEKKEEVKLS